MDRTQEPVKLEVVKIKKISFVPSDQKSSNVNGKMKSCNPDELNLTTPKKIIQLQGGGDTFQEINMHGIEKVVFGSWAVLRLGIHIGNINGYGDWDIDSSTNRNVITKDTLVLATVHDVQVYDTQPENLFHSYDLFLDLIVIWTEVVCQSKLMPRSAGIELKLLSSRCLEENSGKEIELEAEHTDVENYLLKPRQNQRSFRRNQAGQRRHCRSD